MTPQILMRLAPCLVISLLATVAAGENSAPALWGLTLPDQHGVTHVLAPDTRTVLFTADMDASQVVRSVLDRQASNWLEEQRTVFIADIHRMPSLITRFVALPRMRRYPYRILVISDSQTGEGIPRKTGLVTVLSLVELRADRIRYTKDATLLETWIRNDSPGIETPRPVE